MTPGHLSIETLITGLTVLATASMAISGVIQAIRHDLDPFGAGVLGLITAVGGGTVRDFLLGATPVFWITDLVYIATVVPVCVLGVIFAPKLRSGEGRRALILNYVDGIGLALFTLVGVQKALTMGIHPVTAVILGCVTGVAGGMIRDLLCGEQPVVLKQDLYATISLAGGALFVVLNNFLAADISSGISFGLIVVVRFWVIHRRVSFPGLG